MDVVPPGVGVETAVAPGVGATLLDDVTRSVVAGLVVGAVGKKN